MLVPIHWQLQEAKQRFSELVRLAERDGPQFVTRHGQEVVVVLSTEEFHRLRGDVPDFKELLLSGPAFDDLVIRRDDAPPREIELSDFE